MMIEWKMGMSAFDFVKAKYEAKEEVTEKEFKDKLKYNYSKKQSQGSGRWSEQVLYIYSQGDEHYGVEYEEGLTEHQEDYYDEQVPVKLKAKEVTITVYEEDND